MLGSRSISISPVPGLYAVEINLPLGLGLGPFSSASISDTPEPVPTNGGNSVLVISPLGSIGVVLTPDNPKVSSSVISSLGSISVAAVASPATLAAVLCAGDGLGVGVGTSDLSLLNASSIPSSLNKNCGIRIPVSPNVALSLLANSESKVPSKLSPAFVNID